MAIGKRIKFFRTRNGMTQKQLGEDLGFKEKTSDVRMAQYEAEARIPKDDLVETMSQIFEVSPHALTVPDIDSGIGFMHTLFALEDMYGIKIDETDEGICLRPSVDSSIDSIEVREMLLAWKEQAIKLKEEEISQDVYDHWRYKYPELDTTGKWKRTPSKKVSDDMVKTFSDKLKED